MAVTQAHVTSSSLQFPTVGITTSDTSSPFKDKRFLPKPQRLTQPKPLSLSVEYKECDNWDTGSVEKELF